MKFRRLLVYSSILRLMIETYMPICLAVCLGLKNLYGTTMADKLCAVLAWTLPFYCVFLPTRFYRFLRDNRSQLRDPEFQLKYNSIYLGFDTHKLYSLSFMTLQMYRKLVIVLVILFLFSSHIIQVTITLYMQLIMLIYII